MDDLADGRLNRMDEAEIDLQVLSFTQPGARACTLRMRLRHLGKLAFRSFLQAGSGHRAECIWHQAMEMAVAFHFVSVGQAPPDAASKSQFVKVLGAVLDHGLAAIEAACAIVRQSRSSAGAALAAAAIVPPA